MEKFHIIKLIIIYQLNTYVKYIDYEIAEESFFIYRRK